MTTPPPDYPGAVPPERARSVHAGGLRLRVVEWGDPEATPVLLCHGMFDHARSFDVLAPLLADRFRVVAMDARGHGDSDWADAYSWPSDVEDIGFVLEELGQRAHLVGHSKGGGQVTDAASLFPERVRQVVNLDGFGPPDDDGFRPRPDGERDERGLLDLFAEFLDWRSGLAAGPSWRAAPDLDQLVERRQRQNPRLGDEWLRYFVQHAARETPQGWVWKADPLSARGFGPFKARWIGAGWGSLQSPLLAVTGSEPDTWGPIPEAVRSQRLAKVPRLEQAVIEGAGHFVHMERPRETAQLLLGFLDTK